MAKIVVIDDRVTNRNILTRLALSAAEGLQVQAFASAREALGRLRQEAPADLVITDYNMPEMDGAAFITAIRKQPEYFDVPIIVVTAYEDREFCYRALEAGATDFLLSPVDHLEFRARARNLLTMRRQQKLLAERAAVLEQTLREEQRSLAPELSKELKDFLDRLPISFSSVDRHGRVRWVNATHEHCFSVRREEIAGHSLDAIYGDTYATRHNVLNNKVLDSGRSLTTSRHEVVGSPPNEQDHYIVKAPLRDAAGDIESIVTVGLDVTEIHRSSEKRTSGARLDRLTGLINAETFHDRLEQELSRARRQGDIVALLILDLDRFKAINDAFGEAFGDELLRAIAKRLSSRLRESDTLAHLRSDEFVVLQVGLRRPDDAGELARRLTESFAKPFIIKREEIHLSCSIGITIFPTDARVADTLLKNADLAMYRAKSAGRDVFRFFAAEMNIAARRAVTLERELRQALAADQFIVYYQPQMDLGSGRYIGMEALVRWSHPHRGIVRPGEFIPLAEDIGLIAPLTAWVIRTACTQHREWRDKGIEGLQLSVNLSPVQFRERGVELLIERILRETRVEPHTLDIELTENAVIENSGTASASLRYLDQLGVSLSIDDFGTGYSSLSYVKRLPVRRLKIDRSFVQNLEHSTNDELIVRAIINLGHSLSQKVIAEGVETEGQLQRLKQLGCDEVQGDLISVPVDAATFEQQLLGGRRGNGRRALYSSPMGPTEQASG